MFKQLLSSVELLNVWSVITLLIFFFSFVMIIIYTFKIDKKVIDHLSYLPIEDNDNEIS